jgi:putative FmdB family regulatory protein
MPIYEYRCLDCGHEFERMQKFSDPPVDKCPACPGTVQKLISRSAFHLKGNGWYVTDYARKGSNNGSSNTTQSNDSGGTESASAKAASAEQGTAKQDTAKATSDTAKTTQDTTKTTSAAATTS